MEGNKDRKYISADASTIDSNSQGIEVILDQPPVDPDQDQTKDHEVVVHAPADDEFQQEEEEEDDNQQQPLLVGGQSGPTPTPAQMSQAERLLVQAREGLDSAGKAKSLSQRFDSLYKS